MKHFYQLTAVLAITALCSAGNMAEARNASIRPEVNISDVMRRMAPNAGVTLNPRHSKAAKINADIDRRVNRLEAGFAPDEVILPSSTVGPTENFKDMDGPNGEMWYYTTRLWSKPIKYEYYTDYILTEYEFDIYDSNMNPVGKIHDKMRYRDNEVRVPGPALGIDMLPVVTQHFFNTDDKYELVVAIAVNTTTEGRNNYRSVIYSLGGEKETLSVYDPATDGEVQKLCDKPVCEYDAFINDVLDASTDGTENYYMTFSGLHDADVPAAVDDEDSDNDYWEMVKSGRMTLSVCSKADANGNLTVVQEITIPYLNLQGNQETSAVALSMMRNGKPYMVVPHYKDTFFNPYYSTTDDITQREGNSLVIDMYELRPDKAALAYSTEIPMTIDTDHDAYFTYYAVGSLRWADDVDFGHFTTDGTPCFYITRSNFKISTDSESDYCYYVYDSNGRLKKTIFEYADNNIQLTDIEGAEPQQCFIYYDEGYTYYMVDLYTGLNSKTVSIDYLLKTDDDSDADVLLANFDRVPAGNGDWNYCFELKVPTVDEDENDVLRLAWFDKKGAYTRMDYVNMGKNVYYAQSFMNGFALDPKLFKLDNEQEYMVLIKRGISSDTSESQEELIVAQPQSEANDWQGKTLLHLAPCEKGALRGIQITPVADGTNKLMVTWQNADATNNYTADFYDLPFDKQLGVEDAVAGNASRIAYDGASVSCQGEEITVYSMQGISVANARESVSTKSLPAGIYVATAGGSSLKIIVK